MTNDEKIRANIACAKMLGIKFHEIEEGDTKLNYGCGGCEQAMEFFNE